VLACTIFCANSYVAHRRCHPVGDRGFGTEIDIISIQSICSTFLGDPFILV
jgi:hypothetical protein